MKTETMLSKMNELNNTDKFTSTFIGENCFVQSFKYDNPIINEVRMYSYDKNTNKAIPLNAWTFEEFEAALEGCKEEWGIFYLSVLDKEEREYLEAFLKPFKDRVLSIRKDSYETASIEVEEGEYLSIDMKSAIEADCYDTVELPFFKKGSMYRGLKLKKEYTLDELGLFKEDKSTTYSKMKIGRGRSKNI